MKTIEIDNELILVEVPKDAKIIALVSNGIEYISNDKYTVGYVDFKNITYETIGLIETPDLKFDFDVDETWVESIKQFSSVFITGHSIMYKDYMIINKNNEFCLLMKEDSFRTRIQKAIQDIEIKGNLLLIKKLK
jgi:hypothetical protein